MENELRDIACIVVRRSKKFPQSKAVASRTLEGKPVQIESILSALEEVYGRPADFRFLVRQGIASWLNALLFYRTGEIELAREHARKSEQSFSNDNVERGFSP